jgi:hypothetical protein
MSKNIFRKPINISHHKTVIPDIAAKTSSMKTLNDELSKLSIVHLPDLPSIKYSSKKITNYDIDQLIGTYSLWYVHFIEIIAINLYYKY